MSEQSEAEVLQRLPGIGEKKSQRLVEEFGDNPKTAFYGITTASTSSFENIDGISQEAGSQLQDELRQFDLDQGVYDEDPRTRDSETLGEFSSEVNDTIDDFGGSPDDTAGFVEVEETDFTRTERNRAEKFHSVRSERSQSLDESLRAPIADSFDQWRNNKDHFDFPGVDTPPGF